MRGKRESEEKVFVTTELMKVRVFELFKGKFGDWGGEGQAWRFEGHGGSAGGREIRRARGERCWV